MSVVASPNWLILLGLICIVCSLIFLGDAIGSHGTGRSGASGYQRLALAMAMGLLGAGLVLLILGQLAVATMSAPVALATLALAFGLLMFGLQADLAGARLDAATHPFSGELPAGATAVADVHEIDVRRNSDRLRIAG